MGTVAAPAPAKPAVLRMAAFSGSLRKDSWHHGLIRAAEELCEEFIPGLEIDHVDISNLPNANPDLETDDGEGFPPEIEAFRDRVLAADCFLFASPEYNYSVSGSMKNALDWASRGIVKCWADKAAAIVCAGADFGGGRGSLHLRQIGIDLDIHFINKPELHVRAFDNPPKLDAQARGTSPHRCQDQGAAPQEGAPLAPGLGAQAPTSQGRLIYWYGARRCCAFLHYGAAVTVRDATEAANPCMATTRNVVMPKRLWHSALHRLNFSAKEDNGCLYG